MKDRIFQVCLTVLLLVTCIVHASAYRAPRFGQGEIEFSVANQQFFITDRTFDIQFSLKNGSPDQIRFQPSVEAKRNGLTISTDWRYFDFANMSELSFDRPLGIKPGDYECELSIRNSKDPDKAQSMPLLISIVQIDFALEQNIIVCADEKMVQIDIKDVEGRPNMIKILVDKTIDKKWVHETEWMPFDIYEPVITFDIAGIPNGKILTDAISITLADSTTKENNQYVACATQSIWQLGRGDSNKYLGTKFNDCMVYVDNADSETKSRQLTYQWYKDGEMIDDATNQYYYDTDSQGNMMPLHGTYSVDITDEKGNKILICPQSFKSRTVVPYRKSRIIIPQTEETRQNAILQITHSQQDLEHSVIRIYDTDGNLAYIIVGLTENNILPILPPQEYIVVVESTRYKETLKYIVN